MNFITDKFKFRKNILFRPTECLDLTTATEVTNFLIGGVEPTGTERKILFQIGGEFFKFEGNNLLELHLEIDVENVLDFGNTVAELNQVTNIRDFAGKKIYPIVAISYPADAQVIPTLELGLNVKNFQDVFQRAEMSKVFYLGDGATFITATFAKVVSNGGTANLQVRLFNNDTWTNWLEIEDAEFQPCQAVQLRGNFSVTSTSGSSSATITDAKIFYVTGADTSKISTLYLKPEICFDNLGTAYCLVKHSEIVGSDLKAFVRFDSAPEVKTDFFIGIGTGSPQNFELDDGINFDSLIVKVGGVRTFDFTFNAAQKILSLEAGIGLDITVSYEYNIAPEDWLEMEKQFTIFDENFDSGAWTSRFVYRLDTADNSKVAQVKIQSEIFDTDNFQPIKIFQASAGFIL